MTWCGYWGPKATTRHLKPWEIQTQDTLTELAKTRLWNYKGCLVSIYSQCFPAKSLRTKSRLGIARIHLLAQTFGTHETLWEQSCFCFFFHYNAYYKTDAWLQENMWPNLMTLNNNKKRLVGIQRTLFSYFLKTNWSWERESNILGLKIKTRQKRERKKWKDTPLFDRKAKCQLEFS